MADAKENADDPAKVDETNAPAGAEKEETATERRKRIIEERRRKHEEEALAKQRKAQANAAKRQQVYQKAYDKLAEKGQGAVTASMAEVYFEKQQKKEKGTHNVKWVVEDIFRKVKIKNRMDVTIEEFILLIKAIKKEKRSITRCFNEFQIMDNDESGEITIREAAEHIFNVSGTDLDDAAQEKMEMYIKKYDTDGDGLMKFTEFWDFTRTQALIKAGYLIDEMDADKEGDDKNDGAIDNKEELDSKVPSTPEASTPAGTNDIIDDKLEVKKRNPVIDAAVLDKQNQAAGLPLIDYGRLESLFKKMHASSLGVEKDMTHATLTDLLRQIHFLAAHRIGRPVNSVDYEHFALAIMRARRVSSGFGISFDNFKGWIKEGLHMSTEERSVFMEKGQFNVQVGNFLEDVSACCYVGTFSTEWKDGLPLLMKQSLVNRFHEFADKVIFIQGRTGKITSAGLDGEGLLKMILWSREVLRGTRFVIGPLPSANLTQYMIDAFDVDGKRSWSVLNFMTFVDEILSFPALQKQKLHAQGKAMGHAVCFVQVISLSILLENAFKICPRFGESGDEIRPEGAVQSLADCGFKIELAQAQKACSNGKQRGTKKARSPKKEFGSLSFKKFVALAGRALAFPTHLQLFRRDAPFGSGVIKDPSEPYDREADGVANDNRNSKSSFESSGGLDQVPIFLGENFASGSVAVGKIRSELRKMYEDHKTSKDKLTLVDLRHLIQCLPASHRSSRKSQLGQALKTIELPSCQLGANDLPRLFDMLDIRGTGRSISERDFVTFFVDMAKLSDSRRKEWASTSPLHLKVMNLVSILIMVAANGYVRSFNPEELSLKSQPTNKAVSGDLKASVQIKNAHRHRRQKHMAVSRAKWRDMWESDKSRELEGVCNEIDRAWASWDEESPGSFTEAGRSRNSIRQARERNEFLDTIRTSNQRTPKLFRHRAPSPPQSDEGTLYGGSPLARKRTLKTRRRAAERRGRMASPASGVML